MPSHPLRPRLSDVDMIRATYRAQALCTGVDDAGCPWQPFASNDRETRQQAREHVLRTPGHEVVVTVADVARYYLPKALVAALTPESTAGGRDDAPALSGTNQED